MGEIPMVPTKFYKNKHRVKGLGELTNIEGEEGNCTTQEG